MSDKSRNRRRWFSFSLRSMLAAVVVLSVAGAWVGYQLNWIRQRHDVLENDQDSPLWVSVAVLDGAPCTRTPWPLGLFGEEPAGMPTIWLRDSVTDEELTRAQYLFPETEVRRLNDE